MTTRDELIDGFRMIIREGLRTTSAFGPDDWKQQVHGEEGGWNVKQIYCHLAAIADITPGFVGALVTDEEGTDTAAGIDIDALNAQGVAVREGLSDAEVMDGFRASYEKLIEFVRGIQMPQEDLDCKSRFGVIEGPVADVMETLVVLHGLSHIYQAQSRPLS